MRINGSATVWRSEIDAATRNVTFERIYIPSVHWFFKTSANAGKDGLAAANSATIRIPQNVVNGIEAFAVGARIAIGSVDDLQPSENALTVVSVTHNAEGLNPHWKVIAQ